MTHFQTGITVNEIKAQYRKLLTYQPTDISLQTAINAHRGTSFSPEKRGQSICMGLTFPWTLGKSYSLISWKYTRH